VESFHNKRDLKVAFFESDTYFKRVQAQLKQKGSKGFLIFKQKLMSAPIVMSVNSQNVLFEIVDETVQWLITSGIIEWAKKVDWRKMIENSEQDEEELRPKVLDFDSLSHGFVIWLIPCGISSLIFLIERIISPLRRWLRKY
jgi:hypothetical protein